MRPYILFFVTLILAGCRHNSPSGVLCDSVPHGDTVPTTSRPATSCYTPTECRLLEWGLVDVQQLDSSIQVRLIYSTPDNFAGRILYPDIHKAFLLPQLVQKLADAQRELQSMRPNLTLVILDAVRPLSVQRTMFSLVQGTPRNIYVSNPRNGPGLHNYGAAVDITLGDTAGNLLPMGTDFDHFGPESHIDNEGGLLASGLITQQEYDNRRLLRQLMRNQGLITFRSEWWHFNLMSRTRAQQTLKPVDL